MKRHSLIIRVIAAILLLPVAVMAGPDRYLGDSAIYTGDATRVKPNVLLIIDNSKATLDAAASSPYDEETIYAVWNAGANLWLTGGVYKADNQNDYPASQMVVNNSQYDAAHNFTLEKVQCTFTNSDGLSQSVAETLKIYGSYSGTGDNTSPKLKYNQPTGTAICNYQTGSGSESYKLGNFLNFQKAAASGSSTRQKIIWNALKNVVGSTRTAVNFGAMVYDQTGQKGGKVLKPISDISGLTDAQVVTNFMGALPGGSPGYPVLTSETARPQAEALLDALFYFRGEDLPISGQNAMTSPITASCQKNYVIIVTIGQPNNESDSKFAPFPYLANDPDNDGQENGTGSNHWLDDVAMYLNKEADASPSFSGRQSIVTNTVLVFDNEPANGIMHRAANAAHGNGKYYQAYDANSLAKQLSDLILSIVLETNTSFVAPVVPVSPENRTYSGSRVYLGFFKPQSGKPWLGNLKKFGINNNNEVVDKNNVVATNSDGSFKSTAISYWSSASDGGVVDSGGAGQLLKDSSSARSIYTYMGTSTSLTNSTNAFTTDNGAITATTLDVADATERGKIIGFVRGKDTYDDDGDTNITENREWPLGDILHSKPLIVNYTSYDFTAANEADCTVNKALIYVGANDGMLHAFRDCDGHEEWAFIPPDSLSRLKYLRDPIHSYLVDSSPVVYTYDADKDGNIESGDKVVIVFGQRRGGGSDSSPTGGFYYALDVSNPAAPVYMWKLGNTYSPSGTHTDYSEMGETWSEPTIVKMRIGTVDKMVAFVGAGYDNLNEDSRYGATQTYNGTGTVTSTDLGNGAVTSAGTSAAANPKGRGVYAIEIAELNASGVPSFTNSGHKVWGYTHATNSALTFSFASEVSAMDFDYNGYIDRIYIPDTGGNLWKFSVGDTNTSNWTAFKLFASNPGSGGSSDKGRKMFFRPSVVREASYTILYMGSGDREHPLNRNVIDRIYAIKDNAPASTITESSLTDVTLDTLQTTSDTSEVSSILAALTSSSGWYIKLDQNSGEKVVAKSLVFSKAAHYTTHTPNAAPSADPCQPGNLGTGRIYVVDYLTGESVVNYDTGNDSSAPDNARATATEGQVLQRSDRVKTLGSGMPSGVVAIISASGESAIMVGIGGGLAMPETKSDTGVVRIYWREK